MFRPVSAELDFVAIEEAELVRWQSERRLRADHGAARGRRTVGLLRGSADRQRHAGSAPRVGARLQGPLLSLPDHAGPLRRASRRLGHPRSPRRSPGREATGHLGQEGHRRAGRHRGVHSALSRVGADLRRRVRAAHRAHRLLDRHGARVLHLPPVLRGVGVVATAATLRPRVCSTRT